jgi:hypothetical protein
VSPVPPWALFCHKSFPSLATGVAKTIKTCVCRLANLLVAPDPHNFQNYLVCLNAFTSTFKLGGSSETLEPTHKSTRCRNYRRPLSVLFALLSSPLCKSDQKWIRYCQLRVLCFPLHSTWAYGTYTYVWRSILS